MTDCPSNPANVSLREKTASCAFSACNPTSGPTAAGKTLLVCLLPQAAVPLALPLFPARFAAATLFLRSSFSSLPEPPPRV